MVFREAGLSIANINAIIIHANITDDISQQILSEITKANRDLSSAANIYEILDDWNDNKLTARDGAGTTSTGFTNEFAHKSLFRPEWASWQGSGTASGGRLQLAGGGAPPDENSVKTASTFNVGTWEASLQMASNLDADSARISLVLAASSAKKYELRWIGNGAAANYALYDNVDAADVITVAKAADTSAHIIKMTRDGSNNWSIFWDGVQQGSTTADATTTSFDELVCIVYTSAANGSFDWLKVY